MPVSWSGVMLGATTLPNGVGIGSPPAKSWPPGLVWHPAQSPTTARYRPRSTWEKSCGLLAASARPEANTARAIAPASAHFVFPLRPLGGEGGVHCAAMGG